MGGNGGFLRLPTPKPRSKDREEISIREKGKGGVMERRRLYLDLTLVPLSLLSYLLYHCWLWHAVRTRPKRTNIGVTGRGPRVWITAMMKDNDKKNVLAVQTLRNCIMGSTLMAFTSVFLCCGLLSFTSNSYSTMKWGDRELEVSSKCAAVLLPLLSGFLCQCLSIMYLCQVNMLVNTLAIEGCQVTPEHVAKLLEKGLFLSTLGNRLFFFGLPLVLWIFGPALVFLSSVGLIPVLHSLDFVRGNEKGANVAGMSHAESNAAVV